MQKQFLPNKPALSCNHDYLPEAPNVLYPGEQVTTILMNKNIISLFINKSDGEMVV